MTVAWHRTEPREIRPFIETAQAENSLDETGIRLFPDDEFSLETSFDLDESDFKNLTPIVHIKMVDPSTWIAKELSIADIELVVIAKHKFLKRSEIVVRSALGDPSPVEVPIPEDLLADLGGGRDVQIVVALCLKHDRAPVPGTPFIPGHWLAQKIFYLRTRTNPVLFDVRPRTDEEWKKAGFPAKTFFAVEYNGGIDSEMEEGDSIAIVYMHVDAQNKMLDNSLGASLQPFLASEIILTILMQSYSEWKDVSSIDPASPLATLAKQMGRGKPLSLDELKQLVAQPSKLRARLQDQLSVVQSL